MLKKKLQENEKFQSIIDQDLKLEYMLQLPPSLETSFIAKEFEQEGIFMDAAYKLFAKYIDNSAHLQVNISSKIRRELTEIFQQASNTKGKNNEQLIMDILPLIEKAVKEVSYLMNDSHLRYYFIYTSVDG